MNATAFLSSAHSDWFAHRSFAKNLVELPTIALLGYIAVVDFRTFKIKNESVLLLLAFYVLDAFFIRPVPQIASDFLLATIVFVVLLAFYVKGAIGGGDVKFLPVVCLWIGIHSALAFAALLLLFIILHLVAARIGWAQTKTLDGQRVIPYAPSLCGALIGILLLDRI